MAVPRSTHVAAGAVVAVLLLGAAAGVQSVRESRYPPAPAAKASLYLKSGETARRLTKGYSALAADLYWIRAIQYYGDLKLRLAREGGEGASPDADRYELLYPLLDLTTSLDPAFHIAYRFGSIFLAEAFPGGAGRPDLALALLEKGIRDQPTKWEYMQDAGFVHYWWRHDYKAAAEWFARASKVEGAPWFLQPLAATTLAEGGDRNSSRLMWQAIKEAAAADNAWLANDADRRLMQLDAIEFLAAAQQRIDQWTAQAGRPPAEWAELLRTGFIRAIPVDPTGTPLLLEPSGRVMLSPRSPLHPLPDEPKRIGTPGA